MAENSNTQVNGEGSTARIVELAKIITASVSRLEAALSDKGVQLPSFDEDSHHECPIEAFDARDAVLDASSELYDLLLDPLTLILKQGGVRVLDSPYDNAQSLTYSQHTNMICLQAISRFKIADMVPAGGQVPFSDIAKRTGLNEGIVRRLLRYAITMRVFREPQPGLLAHTQASKALTTPSVNYWLSCGSEEMWPASIKVRKTDNNIRFSVY
jgi:hypothetical protein